MGLTRTRFRDDLAAIFREIGITPPPHDVNTGLTLAGLVASRLSYDVDALRQENDAARRIAAAVYEVAKQHRECGKPTFDGCFSHPPMSHCRADGYPWPCDVHRINEAWSAAIKSPSESSEVEPLLRLLERLRKYDHDRHDKGSDEQRAKGDYGPTPVETCQNWFCFHVGVYLRHYGSDR